MSTPDIAQEIKGLKDDISKKFNEQIIELDRKADARWDELKKSPDAVIGESLKSILDDASKKREEREEAFQKALTDRLDEMEAKAKERSGYTEDPHAEMTKALDAFEINPETGKGKTELPIKAVTTITNSNANGATFNQRQPGIREYPQRPLSMRDVVTPGTIDGHFFIYERELAGSLEGDADYQTEASAKAAMDIYTEMVTAFTATIAVTARTSQQVFDDRSAFISFLRGRMGHLVEKKLDTEILNGAGSGDIDGINTNATAYNNGHLTGMDQPTTVQKLDVLRFARNQVELNFFAPNFSVLHPTDWAGIETLKDGDEKYLIGDPRTGGSTGFGRVGAVWGMPVISTAAQTATEFTVGDGMQAQLFMRQGLSILASTEDQDNFVKNLVTLRAELRALQAIYATTAFVTGDFADAIAAT